MSDTSTDTNSNPSRDPANEGTLAGLFMEILKKFLQNVDGMLPAVVTAYDRPSNRASVQPQVMILTTDDQTISRAPIASVPVLQIGAGMFGLFFPVNPGDFGYIFAADRDISLFLQGMAEAGPNTTRLHSFSDGIFIPDAALKTVVIDGEDEGNVILQTLDGTQRVAVWADRVKLTSTQLVHLDAPNILLDAPVTTITGALIANSAKAPGNATFDGTIHATGDVIAGDISLDSHVHTGVQSGSSETGGPVG